MTTDLTFFTNEPDAALLDRFKVTLRDVQFFDVLVGLGKTFIAALLAQQLPGRKLVICPPVLKDYWQDTLREFGVPARVESMGKLDHILEGDYQRYDVVFVGEAHRFRNEGTPRLAIPAGYLDGPQTAGTGAAQPVEVILSEYVAVQQGGE